MAVRLFTGYWLLDPDHMGSDMVVPGALVTLVGSKRGDGVPHARVCGISSVPHDAAPTVDTHFCTGGRLHHFTDNTLYSARDPGALTPGQVARVLCTRKAHVSAPDGRLVFECDDPMPQAVAVLVTGSPGPPGAPRGRRRRCPCALM